MMDMAEGPSEVKDGRGVGLVVASIFGVFLVFVVLQLVGNPDNQIGSLSVSLLYSVVVYIPVFVVCAIALMKARR